jgi:hypothetical protein
MKTRTGKTAAKLGNKRQAIDPEAMAIIHEAVKGTNRKSRTVELPVYTTNWMTDTHKLKLFTQTSMPQEFSEVIDKHFWELI